MNGSWNVASGVYGKRNGWEEDEFTNKVMIVQSVTIAGTALGALFSGKISYLGRWKCILYANFLLIFGVGISIITDNFALLCIGRFVYGVSVGIFSVFCPKYISETAPIEIKGSAVALC